MNIIRHFKTLGSEQLILLLFFSLQLWQCTQAKIKQNDVEIHCWTLSAQHVATTILWIRSANPSFPLELYLNSALLIGLMSKLPFNRSKLHRQQCFWQALLTYCRVTFWYQIDSRWSWRWTLPVLITFWVGSADQRESVCHIMIILFIHWTDPSCVGKKQRVVLQFKSTTE